MVGLLKVEIVSLPASLKSSSRIEHFKRDLFFSRFGPLGFWEEFSEVAPGLLRSCFYVEISRHSAFRGSFLEVCFRTRNLTFRGFDGFGGFGGFGRLGRDL